MNLPRFGVKNPVTVNLIMWAVILGGIHSWNTMIRGFFPDFEPEQIRVVVPWPGATPEDVEKAIALPIERELRELDDVEEMEGAVFEGVALFTLTLEGGADRDRALNATRSAIDRARPQMPAGIEEPEILEVRPYIPVLSVVVHGDVPEERLRDAALEVRDDLLDLGGVTEVRILGLRKREVWAEVEPARLEEHDLTFEEVGRAVGAANLDLPAGELKGARGNVRVRTVGEQHRARRIEDLVVRGGPQGDALRLRDLARVEDTFEDRTLFGRFQGRPAVSLYVFKTPEQDALDIAEAVKRHVAEHPTRLHGAVDLAITTDISRFIAQRLDLMVRNARAGLLLVLLTLALFLDLKTSFWVGFGLPTALLGTFLGMQLLGLTINLISLFGLIIVLGLIVDDALVVGEAVRGHVERGMPPGEAAVKGADEMGLPVLASVSTTVVAFLPLAFIAGQMGDFLREIPIVVMVALLASLVEAFLILPAHLGHPWRLRLRLPFAAAGARLGATRDRIVGRVLPERFGHLLETVLRWRYVTIAGVVAVFLASVGFVAGGIVPFVLLQEVDAESVRATLEMAPGTPAHRTTEVLATIEEDALAYPEVRSAFSVVGTSFSDRGQETAADPATVGQVYLELVAADEREERGMRTSVTIIEELRARSAQLAGIDRLAWVAESGSPQGADVEVRLRGEDLAAVSVAADHVMSLLHEYEGVAEIEKDLREGKLEATLRLAPGAETLGLATADLAANVRHALFGFVAQELQEEDDEVKVRVLLPEAARRDLADLAQLRVRAPHGGRVPLGEVATLETGRGVAQLRRVDGRRSVTVTASVDEQRANVQQITADLGRRLGDLPERFPGVSFSFEGRQKETRESLGSLAIAYPAALLGVFALIAMLFRSYAQPLVVMCVIPFSLTGALLGHLLMGYPFTLLSLIGAVALSGIVVNDSIILVDRVNRLRREGVALHEAVVTGAKSRLRAILLTTLTTASGLAPLLLERSFQAQFLIPMAISIVFGLLAATALTLFLLPCLYLAYEDVKRAVLAALRMGPAATPR